MKKIKYIILYFLIFTGTVLYAQNPVFSLSSGLQTTVGQTISVQLSVDVDLSSYNVLGYKFAFSYNATLLKIKSVQYDNKLQDFTNIANTQQTGKVILTGASANKIQGNGTLITLTFEALASGNATLNYITAECLLNEGTPAATYLNGNINIAPKPVITISPNTVLLAVGQTAQCAVSGNKTPPYTWAVSDISVATISESGLVTATKHGRTKIFVEDAAGLRDTTDGFFNVTAIRLYFPQNLQEWQGWEVTIPVKTTDFSSINIVSGQFSLSYRSDVLQFLGTETAGSLLENSSVSATEIQSGKIRLAFASAQALGASSDELIGLRFRVLPNATAVTNLSFSDVIFNEDVYAVSENGNFAPKILPILSLSPTSGSLVAGDSLLFTATNGIEPYTWSVSDERVAKIHQNGWLIANEGGSVNLTVTDAVGAVKNINEIKVYDTQMYFPLDTLESIGDTTYTRCLVDSIPIGRPAISSIEGEISVSNTNIKILDIETQGTFTEGWQKIITPVSDQRIKFYLAGATPFRQKGIAFYLKTALLPAFKEYDKSEIRFHNIQINEGTPNSLFINGSLEGKLFTDQDKTICLGESTGELIAHETKGKTISKWQKRIRKISTTWTNIGNTDSIYSDTPNALGEWEYCAIIDGIATKVANILVKTIPDIHGEIHGETEFCNIPQTFRYYVERRPTATEYHWHYRGEGAILHPNKNVLDLEITNDITPGYLVMHTANSCGESTDSLTLELHPLIQPAAFTFKMDSTYFSRDTVSFTDTSVGALTWTWDVSPISGVVFANNTNAQSQNPEIQFTQAGSYRIKLETTNSCQVDSAVQIVVIHQFENGTVILDNNTGCLGTTFQAELTQSSGTVNAWQIQTDGDTQWTDLPSSNLDLINYTPTAVGTYHIRAKLDFTRGYSTSETIIVNPVYNLSEQVDVCANSNYTFPDGTEQTSITEDISHVSNLTTVSGCDSIVTTNLTVIVTDVSVTQKNDTLTANIEGASYKWLDCDNDNSPIEGEIGQTFIPVASGHYAVEVTAEGCTKVSPCYEVIISAVGNIFGDEFKLYPNPTNGYINIDFGENIPDIKLSITDITGRTLLTKEYKNRQDLELSLHHFSSGIYFIYITKENKTATFKVIKNKL